jgi:hypothetical protein
MIQGIPTDKPIGVSQPIANAMGAGVALANRLNKELFFNRLRDPFWNPSTKLHYVAGNRGVVNAAITKKGADGIPASSIKESMGDAIVTFTGTKWVPSAITMQRIWIIAPDPDSVAPVIQNHPDGTPSPIIATKADYRIGEITGITDETKIDWTLVQGKLFYPPNCCDTDETNLNNLYSCLFYSLESSFGSIKETKINLFDDYFLSNLGLNYKAPSVYVPAAIRDTNLSLSSLKCTMSNSSPFLNFSIRFNYDWVEEICPQKDKTKSPICSCFFCSHGTPANVQSVASMGSSATAVLQGEGSHGLHTHYTLLRVFADSISAPLGDYKYVYEEDLTGILREDRSQNCCIHLCDVPLWAFTVNDDPDDFVNQSYVCGSGQCYNGNATVNLPFFVFCVSDLPSDSTFLGESEKKYNIHFARFVEMV